MREAINPRYTVTWRHASRELQLGRSPDEGEADRTESPADSPQPGERKGMGMGTKLTDIFTVCGR
jgi:hypothetical protein